LVKTPLSLRERAGVRAVAARHRFGTALTLTLSHEEREWWWPS